MSDETLRPFLEGWTLDQVIEAKRLFIVDHDILTGLPCRDGFIVSKTNVYTDFCHHTKREHSGSVVEGLT